MVDVELVVRTSTDLAFSRSVVATRLVGEDGLEGDAEREREPLDTLLGFSSESELFQLRALFRLVLVSLSSISVWV